ncbi:mechanosensitive ion channel [Nocardioides rotundus]|uniref:mechanosensitive ion channel n=2 Tax=Bacteria TaxID=2 RepID=UPI001CC0072E|nr:mechanosensitive ion channel [Nocardioides rotundus]UAL29674.1 mechanosensitive ion channel [Nocardioides rotundus]
MNGIDWSSILEKAAYAIIVLLITWILAKVVKWLFTKLTGRISALRHAGSNGETLGESLGTMASLVVWLLGLIAILQVFGLSQVLTPIQTMLNKLLEFLPNIIGAAVVFFVGFLLAKIVRELLQRVLETLPLERWFRSAGARASRETGTATAASAASGSSETTSTESRAEGSTLTTTVATTVATVAYALILIVVAIASLQILGIEAISRPAEQMLTAIFDAIPNIIAAGLLLALGVLIANFVGDILTTLLDGLGLDRALNQVDALPEGRSASPIIAKVAQIGIVLFFAVMAAQLLGFPQITRFLSEVLALGGKVIFGAAIIAVGFFVANLLARMMGDSGTGATVVKYATLVLFVAMGLSYMGIADSIIELAFGALVVGGAAAAALAFGLGGRDAAARQLESLSRRRGSSGDGQTSRPSV